MEGLITVVALTIFRLVLPFGLLLLIGSLVQQQQSSRS
jgi:hypothetical protein